MKHLIALVFCILATLPGVRAKIRGFTARSFGLLTLVCLLVAMPAKAQVNYAVSGNTASVTSSPGASGDIVITSTYNGFPVTSIGTGAFFNCTNLTGVTIPNSVTGIGNGAFSRCKSLTSANIPNGVTNIGQLAFSNCISLTSVTIPNGVTGIGFQAFRDCWGLTSVSMGNSVTNIGPLAFSRCPSLTNLSVDAANPAYSSLDGVLFNKAQTTLLTYPGGRAGGYVIPNGVTNIGESAFSDSPSLTSVTMANSVTAIGTLAFYNCTSVTNLTIGNGVTVIGSQAFWNCTNLTTVTIPDSVTIVGHYSFHSCRSLKSVTFGNHVTYIGQQAFQNCTGLTNVTIPNSVTNMGGDVFYGCSSVTSVRIGNGLTSIAPSAFYGCTNLTSASIGNGVTNIWYFAFSFCTNLTNFTFLGHAPGLSDGTFLNVGTGAKVYYYCGTTGWGATYGGLPTVMLCPPQIAPGGFGFTVTRLTNQTIVVEASTNLLNWQPIWTNPPPGASAGASAGFVDPQWGTQPRRFYRARSD